jgi:hypothetical protein
MIMQNGIWTRGFAFGIILLFVGTNIIPSISGNIENKKYTPQKKTFFLQSVNISQNTSTIKESIVFDELKNHLPLDNPSWQWAIRAGGYGTDFSNDICVDSNSNTYIIGSFQDVASFGSINLTSSGYSDVFVAKIDTNGVWQWAVRGGGILWDDGYSICIDPGGNIYICGLFEGNASFGSTTFINSDYCDVFVAKLNTDGVWQWAIRGGGDNNSIFCKDICVDSNDNLYITGHFYFNSSFGSTNLSGYYDVFVAKLSNNGVWQWAVSGGGTDMDESYGICVDSSSYSYITGFFQGNASFGSINLTSSGYSDVFVAKLDTNGVWQWAIRAGGNQPDLSSAGVDICIDPSRNIYIIGDFYGNATFGSTTLTSSGYSDVFVAKLDTNGVWQWAVRGGGDSGDESFNICIDSNGDIYITGIYLVVTEFGSTTLIHTTDCEFDIFVVKLSNNGAWLWAVNAGGYSRWTNPDYLSFCLDTSGNIYVTGDFENFMWIGPTKLTASGDSDVFIAKLGIGGENQHNVIIVCGSVHDSSQPSTDVEFFERTANWVYQTYKSLGYNDDDIFYLSGGKYYTNGVDGLDYKTNIQNAITGWLNDRTWQNSNYFFYFIGHGYENTGAVVVQHPENTDDYIFPSEFSEWFDSIDNYHTGIFLIESCFSGFFIDALSKGNEQRIIMTSTDKYTEGYSDWFDEGGMFKFSHGYFKALATDVSYGKAWEAGDTQVDEFSNSNIRYNFMKNAIMKIMKNKMNDITNRPYFTKISSMPISGIAHSLIEKVLYLRYSRGGDEQNPLIDDNGNGIGCGTSASDTLPLWDGTGWDGNLALNTFP